jgi:hypothetical protein
MAIATSIRASILVALVLSVLGCDDKRVKECLTKCSEAASQCEKSRGHECATRAKECEAACKK